VIITSPVFFITVKLKLHHQTSCINQSIRVFDSKLTPAAHRYIQCN